MCQDLFQGLGVRNGKRQAPFLALSQRKQRREGVGGRKNACNDVEQAGVSSLTQWSIWALKRWLMAGHIIPVSRNRPLEEHRKGG